MTGAWTKFAGWTSLACKQAGTSLLELALPPACRLCNAPLAAGDFCRSCETALRRTEPMMSSACGRCGIPRVRPSATTILDQRPAEVPDRPCVHCREKQYGFDDVIPLWAYQDLVCEAVVAAKYAHHSPLADALGRRLAARISACPDCQRPDLVTFVPSQLTRRLVRGGNGNETLARTVARQLGRPLLDLLRMTRRIAKQAWLDDQARSENVRRAFALKKSYALFRSQNLLDRHVLLVDDVLTTGATAGEVARVLRHGGARRVTLAVVARALRS